MSTLRRRYRSRRWARGARRFCVRRGGRFIVAAKRNRINLVASTARGHRTRATGPGRRLRRGRLRGTRRVRRGMLVGQRSRVGRVIYRTRRGRVRYLAVVTRKQAARPGRLARRLRALRLR